MPRCTTTLADTPLRESSQAGNLITDNFAPRRTWGLLYLDSRMSRSREGELTRGTVPVGFAIRRANQRFESEFRSFGGGFGGCDGRVSSQDR